MPTSGGDDNDYDGSDQPLLSTWCSWSPSVPSHARRRRQVRDWLSSKTKHYIVMGLVAMDVAVIITDIFVSLVACDLKLDRDGWVEQTREALHLTALVFSCLFLLELLVTVWAFGLRFFHDWFHCFDALIIVASFSLDVITRGIIEELGSLIIILRLFRLVKIVEELGLGESERLEEMEAKMAELERENSDLKARAAAGTNV